jgi:hypothetical protein
VFLLLSFHALEKEKLHHLLHEKKFLRSWSEQLISRIEKMFQLLFSAAPNDEIDITFDVLT